MGEEKQYRKVKITAGKRGWGGPLIIDPQPGKDLIYCVTGGGIHPLAQHIADLTGGTVFDGFKSKRDFSEIAVAVIDCGGTARVGVYPMKGVLTVDIHSTKPSGPLFRFITKELFVSGVSNENVELIDGDSTPVAGAAETMATAAAAAEEKVTAAKAEAEKIAAKAAEKAADSAQEGNQKKSGFFKRLFGG